MTDIYILLPNLIRSGCLKCKKYKIFRWNCYFWGISVVRVSVLTKVRLQYIAEYKYNVHIYKYVEASMLITMKSVQYSLFWLSAELCGNFAIESNVWRQDETWQDFARIRIHMVNGKKSGYPDRNLFGNSRLMAKEILLGLRFPPSLPRVC